jgi:hypothetical protein
MHGLLMAGAPIHWRCRRCAGSTYGHDVILDDDASPLQPPHPKMKNVGDEHCADTQPQYHSQSQLQSQPQLQSQSHPQVTRFLKVYST